MILIKTAKYYTKLCFRYVIKNYDICEIFYDEMDRIKLYLHRNIQIVYFWIFVLVLLVPNFIILDIAPKPLYMVIPYLAIPMSLYMVLLSLSRKPGYMLIFAFPIIFIGAFQMVLITLSNSTVIGADMFTNIFTTNTSEATDVLATLVGTIFNLLLLYGGAYVLAYFSIKSKIIRPIHFYYKILWGALVLFFVGVSFICISLSKNPYYSTLQELFPINVVNNLRVSIVRWKMSKAYPETSKEFRFNATVAAKEQREIYILVVGESSRADRWGIYGYERPTTPILEGMGSDIIKMSDAVTESNTTHKSTALIMSSVSAVDFEKVYTQKSIVSAFSEAGFKTLFISNQGANGSFMDFYASEATKRVDLPSREAESGVVVGYDTESIAHVKEYIASNNDDILIVIHSYGSHLQYHDRYTKEFEKYSPACSSSIQEKDKVALNNSYDNTILYSDYFLTQLIQTLDSTNVCGGFMYVSDHGEDLLDDARKRFLHSSPTLTYYQLHIPYFMWFSDEYKQHYGQKYESALLNKTKAVTTGSVFHTILDIADIKTTYLKDDESIVSPMFTEKPRMFLDDLYHPVYFANTGLQAIDFELLKKKNIKFDDKLVK